MSSVDERIVKMQFDNSQFESKVSDTLKSITNLNGALDNLKGIDTKGLSDNIGNIDESISGLSDRFSALGIVGMAVLTELATKAVDLGLSLAQSLTTDQIMNGFEKYTSATKDVKAIMNQTDQTIEKVTDDVEKLSWYSDATSYSYTSMVTALKKFTSQNIGTDESIQMIMGIGNSLSYTGLAAEEASFGFDIYSKALAQGYMSQIQWKSLANQGATSAKLKQQFIDAAVAIGTLKENADGTYETLNGLAVSIEEFDSTLSNQKGKWLTTDVMKQVFGNEYGGYVTEVQKTANAFSELAESEISANEAMEVYDKVLEIVNKEGFDPNKIKEYSKEFQKFVDDDFGVMLSDEKAQEMFTLLSENASEIDSLGKRYFLAAQEARTFSEAVGAVKDASSSAWSKVFQNILGNAEESTEVWTSFSDWLYDMTMGPMETLAKVTNIWNNTFGGRGHMLNAFSNFAKALDSYLGPIHEAFGEVFGTYTYKELAEKLSNVTIKFEEFAEKLILSEEQSESLKKIFEGLFSAIDSIGVIAKRVFQILEPIASAVFKPLAKFAIEAALGLSEFLISVRDSLDSDAEFSLMLYKWLNFISGLKEGLNDLGDVAINIFKKIKDGILTVIGAMKSSFGEGLSLFDLFGIGAGLVGFQKLYDLIWEFKGLDFLGSIRDDLTQVYSTLYAFADQFRSTSLLKTSSALLIFAAALMMLSSIDGSKLAKSLVAITAGLALMIGTIKALNVVSGGNKKGISKFLNLFGDKTGMYTTQMIKVAAAVLILAAAMKIIGSMETGEVLRAVVGVGAILTELGVFMALMSKVKATKLTGIIGLATGLVLIAASMKIFATMSWEDIGKGAAVIAGFLVVFAVFAKAMESVKVSTLLALSGSLLIFAGAVLVLSAGLAVLSLVPFEKLMQGLLAVGGMFTILALAAEVLDGKIIAKMAAIGAVIAVVGIGLIAFAAGLAALTLINYNNVGNGLLVLAGALAALALFADLLPVSVVAKMAAISVVMIAIGAAMLVMSAGLAALSAINFEEVMPGLAAFLIFLLGFAGLAAILTPALIPMLGLAAAILAISVAVLALGAGLALLGGIDGGMITANATAMAALTVAAVALGVILALLTSEVALITLELVAMIVELIAIGVEVVAVTLLVGLLTLGVTALDVALGLLVLTLGTLAVIVGALSGNFSSMKDSVVKTVSGMKDSVVKTLSTLGSDFKTAAHNAITGFINGIKDKISAAVTTVKGLGTSVLNGLKQKLGIASPSKEFAKIGKFADQGLANGINQYARVAENAASDLGDNTISALNDSVNSIMDLDDNIDANPTITPVLDLTEIQNGSKELDSMLNSQDLAASVTGNIASIDGTYSLADQVQSLRSELQAMIDSQIGNSDIGTRITEALNGMGVYMDSKKVGNLVTRYQSNASRAGGY